MNKATLYQQLAPEASLADALKPCSHELLLSAGVAAVAGASVLLPCRRGSKLPRLAMRCKISIARS